MPRTYPILLAGLLLASAAFAVSADEGMWLYNEVPRALLQQRYGFSPTDAWLDHLRLSSVRFNNGGSGSFVSPDGLVFTNHHVGAECIQELSTSENNYRESGFYAPSRDRELRCPQLELNVLVNMTDVTNAVNAEVSPGMSASARLAAQRAAMTRLEKTCTEQTGNRCDVVTFFEGGAFHLYEYKKYTDIRLVFAPEAAVAFFGGDPDNFTYPRYDLDVSFFRVYEEGKPAHTGNYLTWNPNGIKEEDLVFVSGHPGSTGRQQTLAQMEFLRDVSYPERIRQRESRLQALREYAARSPENARRATDRIFGYENSLKAYTGYLTGLLDKQRMDAKAAAERRLREAVAVDSEMGKKYSEAWDRIAQAHTEYLKFRKEYVALENLAMVPLFEFARDLVRLPAERALPDEDRLREYRESHLPVVRQELLSEVPVYKDLNAVLLQSALTEMQDALGSDHALVRRILQGRTPQQAAGEIVKGSGLDSAEARRALFDGGSEAVAASQDSMVQLATLVDARARELRTRYEEQVEAVEQQNGALIAEAFFAVNGRDTYPEATFTLRLSFGAVRGYTEHGLPRRWYTTFHGLYEREAGIDPYKLPSRWLGAKSRLDLDTPLNFVSTNDIIGGNSGSPVVNRAGELVGIIFDGNIQQLPNRFVYRDHVERAVSVHAAGILEALAEIYRAYAVLEELHVTGR